MMWQRQVSSGGDGHPRDHLLTMSIMVGHTTAPMRFLRLIKANPQVGRQGLWRQLETAPSGGQ